MRIPLGSWELTADRKSRKRLGLAVGRARPEVDLECELRQELSPTSLSTVEVLFGHEEL